MLKKRVVAYQSTRVAAHSRSVIYQNNVDPVTISRRLGHSRVSTTQDIYCHLLEQADDMARDAIGEVLFGEKKKQPPTPGKQSAR